MFSSLPGLTSFFSFLFSKHRVLKPVGMVDIMHLAHHPILPTLILLLYSVAFPFASVFSLSTLCRTELLPLKLCPP